MQQINNPNIRQIGNKKKLTKDIVKQDAGVFLKAIQGNTNKNFSDIWGLYNNNANYPHQSGMHAGHIVFPTYTATDHPILCNTLPDSLLLKQIVCDEELMETYNKIYKYFYVRITNKSEYKVWETQCPFFFIDAFKVLLAGHYMAYNIFWLEQLSKKQKNGIYTYQYGPYQITWKQQTVQQFPYKDFLNTLREIDKQEDFLKMMQSYIVETNKPGGTRNNPSFALAAKYFIDELLINNQQRKNEQQQTHNFNMVFDALVVSEINGANQQDKYTKFLKYLQEYQNKFPNIPNNNVYDAINSIINNGYDPDINCINGMKNGIAKLNTNNLNKFNYIQNKT